MFNIMLSLYHRYIIGNTKELNEWGKIQLKFFYYFFLFLFFLYLLRFGSLTAHKRIHSFFFIVKLQYAWFHTTYRVTYTDETLFCMYFFIYFCSQNIII